MTTNNAANQSQTGLQSLTSAGVFNGRTITGTANQVGVTNGDGTGGNPTIALTSTIYVSGISFDSGAHTLSTYANGTFSPTLTGSTTNPTVGYGNQVGFYVKVGSICYINLTLTLTSTSGGTGNVRLSALPFTSANNANAQSEGAILIGNVTFGALVSYYTGTVPVNSAFALVEGVITASAVLDLALTGLSATAAFDFSAGYNI